MRTLCATLAVLVFVCSTFLAICSTSMEMKYCALMTTALAAPMDSSSTDTHPIAPFAMLTQCVDVWPSAPSLAALNPLDLSGQLIPSLAPAPTDTSPQLIDPPPRWSSI